MADGEAVTQPVRTGTLFSSNKHGRHHIDLLPPGHLLR